MIFQQLFSDNLKYMKLVPISYTQGRFRLICSNGRDLSQITMLSFAISHTLACHVFFPAYLITSHFIFDLGLSLFTIGPPPKIAGLWVITSRSPIFLSPHLSFSAPDFLVVYWRGMIEDVGTYNDYCQGLRNLAM